MSVMVLPLVDFARILWGSHGVSPNMNSLDDIAEDLARLSELNARYYNTTYARAMAMEGEPPAVGFTADEIKGKYAQLKNRYQKIGVGKCFSALNRLAYNLDGSEEVEDALARVRPHLLYNLGHLLSERTSIKW